MFEKLVDNALTVAIVVAMLAFAAHIVFSMDAAVTKVSARGVEPTCWEVEDGPVICMVELPDGAVCYWTPNSYASVRCEREVK